MAKDQDEIAGEILISLLQARAQAIAAIRDNVPATAEFIKHYLSDAAVEKSYKTIFKAIVDAYSNR